MQMTNFERIKKMNVEEMANAMFKETICGCYSLYDEYEYISLAGKHRIETENNYKENFKLQAKKFKSSS